MIWSHCIPPTLPTPIPCWQHFWQLLEKIGLLFISCSGHTASHPHYLHPSLACIKRGANNPRSLLLSLESGKISFSQFFLHFWGCDDDDGLRWGKWNCLSVAFTKKWHQTLVATNKRNLKHRLPIISSILVTQWHPHQPLFIEQAIQIGKCKDPKSY